jgi:enamine deaminase RidA (YjgF/YER057c/UK114 family)
MYDKVEAPAELVKQAVQVRLRTPTITDRRRQLRIYQTMRSRRPLRSDLQAGSRPYRLAIFYTLDIFKGTPAFSAPTGNLRSELAASSILSEHFEFLQRSVPAYADRVSEHTDCRYRHRILVLDQDDALWNSSSLRFAAWSTVETIQNPAMASKGMEVSNIKRVGGGDHYSGYVEFNGIVTLRGITASDRCTAIKGQTEDCLSQVDALLASAGTSKTSLLTATVYLSNMADKDGMNEAWRAWLDPVAKPTRATVQTVLGIPDTLVEIVLSAAK